MDELLLRSGSWGWFLSRLGALGIAVALIMMAAPLVHAELPQPISPHLDSDGKDLGMGSGFDGREGGETIEDAFLIAELPFEDTGATCDNIDDYFEACPYSGGWAPDVVYAYTPESDARIDIDLCQSLYDTQVYVYDFEAGFGFWNPLACNEDALCGYSGYQSRIAELEVLADHTYYIVVDGYGGCCGEYTLSVSERVPCVLVLPPDAYSESEPPLVDGYEDLWNGGCNSPPEYSFQTLRGGENGELNLYCNAGNFLYDGSPWRDTDWFTVYKSAEPFEVAAFAECPTVIMQLSFDPVERCEGSITVAQSMTLEPCVESTLSLTADIGDEVWVFCACDGFQSFPEYHYLLRFRGIGGAHTPARVSTWSRIKKMFTRE